MYGQYSAMGGNNRTKPSMIAIFESQGYSIDPKQARKGGRNRLHFKDTVTGIECFTLHETVVATYDATKREITLSDGGWHTPTTKSAWGDALAAFNIPKPEKRFDPSEHATQYGFGDIGPDGVTRGYWHQPSACALRPSRDERSVTFIPGDVLNTWVRKADVSDHPLLRAAVDDGSNVAVRFDGKALTSEAGVVVKVRPDRLLAVLYTVDALVKSWGGAGTLRGYALDSRYFEALGFHIQCGQTARMVMVGCHTFRTRDVRSFKRAIEARYPDAVKPGKTLAKKHMPDFGEKRSGLIAD